MRIAQIAPLAEAVPPKCYGGTERVVSYLTEELVLLRHDVTLFASGDSVTSARLVPMWPRATRLDPDIQDPLAPIFHMLERAYDRAGEFDVLHFHLDYLPFRLFSTQPTPFLSTMHGRMDLPEKWPIYEAHSDLPLVSISDAQRRPLPRASWVATVHHGLPEHLLTPRPVRPSYLAFLGRISPEKRVDRAIEIADRAGLPLKIAAKVDRADLDYFEECIRPLLDHPHVEMVGEIGEAEKAEFLSGAHALLFPIDWPEPFGLVMIEAMACGTPVIAFEGGSVREVVENGVTGFVVHDISRAAAAVARLPELSRIAVRRRFEDRFTARRMARDYLGLYDRLTGLARSPRGPQLSPARRARASGDSAVLPGQALGG
jgi:glycosyltransferase involved in cell wall biosynthesis